MAALWKIGVLFAKTISKPLAKNLNKRAANEGMLRDLCERYGQLHHNIETRITLRIQGHRAVRIKKLTTDKAVSKGADIMSEAFIFGTAAMLVIVEYARKDAVAVEKAAVNRSKKAEEYQAINSRFEVMLGRIDALERKQDALVHAILGMEDELVKKKLVKLPQVRAMFHDTNDVNRDRER